MTHSYRSIWMNGFLKLSGVVLIFSALAFPADGMIESTWSKTDAALDTNPDSQFWRGAPPAYMEKDSLHKPHHEDGWTWNSGFEVSARIDQAAHVWYGAMRIPYSAINTRPAASGNSLRVNLFRSQGPESHRQEIAWRAPMSDTFHVPER